MEIYLDQKAVQLNKKAKMIQIKDKKRQQIGDYLRDARSSLNIKNQQLEEAYHGIHKLYKWWKQVTNPRSK